MKRLWLSLVVVLLILPLQVSAKKPNWVAEKDGKPDWVEEKNLEKDDLDDDGKPEWVAEMQKAKKEEKDGVCSLSITNEDWLLSLDSYKCKVKFAGKQLEIYKWLSDVEPVNPVGTYETYFNYPMVADGMYEITYTRKVLYSEEYEGGLLVFGETLTYEYLDGEEEMKVNLLEDQYEETYGLYSGGLGKNPLMKNLEEELEE